MNCAPSSGSIEIALSRREGVQRSSQSAGSADPSNAFRLFSVILFPTYSVFRVERFVFLSLIPIAYYPLRVEFHVVFKRHAVLPKL
jgi:hypothetical protein